MQKIKIKAHDLNRLRKGKERGTMCPRRAGRALQQEKGAGSSQLHLLPHAIYCKSIERTMEEKVRGRVVHLGREKSKWPWLSRHWRQAVVSRVL